MRLRRRLLAVLLLAASAAAPAAFAADGEVLKATLDNGLRVVIVPNKLAPVVTTEINYLVGSDQTPAGFPGSAHALEHMAFRGSQGLDKDQLSALAASMGGNFNADTQQSVTQYFFTVPKEDLALALHIESLRMRGLDLKQDEWTKERGAIEQEVARDLSNPQYKFYAQLLAALFKGTPYAHDALGTRPSFDKTTAADLKSFYDRWYAPNNAVLVIAGDVDPAAALAQVKTLFGAIPRQALPARPTFDFQTVNAQTLQLPTDSPFGLAIMAWRLPGYTDKDHAAAEILIDALGSQRGDLYGLVPQGKALYAGFEGNMLPHAGIGFAVGAYHKGGDPKALLDAMQASLGATLKQGVPAALVEAAKRQEIAQLEFQKNSISGLANAWSDALAVQGLQSPDDLIAQFAAVTPADVDRLVRQLLQPGRAITAVLDPQSSGKAVASKGYGGAESFASTPDKPVTLPAWASQGLTQLVQPSWNVHPSVSVLPNGLRLIVQPENVSDTVGIYGQVRSQPLLQTPAGQEGVGRVLDGLYDYGTTSLDRLAFLSAGDAISAQIAAGTAFRATVPAAQFERAVQLLADDELHPALPAQAFQVVQTQQAQTQAGVLQSPDYLFGRALDQALVPSGDPSLRQTTPQSLSRLSLAQVQAYHAQTIRPDLTTIVVIGKITPAQAQAVIGKYFGDWHAQGAKPALQLAPVPANAPATFTVPDQTSVQDQVTLVQNVGVDLKHPDHYALNLGNQILSGGLYASRLMADLREKAGLVYGVDSQFDFGDTRSQFAVTYGADPDKVAQARQLVIRDLKQMQTAPVTQAELDRAKGTMLRQFALGQASTEAIADELLYLDQHQLPLDQPLLTAQHYLALTPAQVQSAFQHWLRPDGLVEGIKGPAPK
ncbi:MAG: pitrilysin family protein [Dyella sp.]